VTFVNPLPWWALLLAAAAGALIAWNAYRRVPLSAGRRAVLFTLRFTALAWLVVCLMRPVSAPRETDLHDSIVPVLVDASRSMGLTDAGGLRRIDRARTLLSHDILPQVSAHFRTELLRFGDRLQETDAAGVSATDRRTDLAAALEGVRDHYRGQAVAGIVVLSDGGDNGGGDFVSAASGGPPIYTIGVGAASVARDREITSVTAADSVQPDALVDVAVSAVSHGYGRTPYDLRLLDNGRVVDLRRVTPAGDGVPVSTTFRVSPNRDAPAVYTVEVPSSSDELALENNARSVLVPPPARPRRILFVEGAPGFEHSFLKRAWDGDRGLEVDSVVRKGRDDSGADTFYVQAARSRASALVGGYPRTREELFAYDLVVLGNEEADSMTNAQLELTRAFVGERGGGLLVLGARAFQRHSFRGTPLEDVLPLELTDRSTGVVHASAPPGSNRVALTSAGAAHPIMQLGPTPSENAKRWSAIPPLAAVSPLGDPRPGAAVLAVSGGPGGVPRALVAVQRYGDGRSMAFTGEGVWRWRMMLPASDQSYDRFWRQAARWLGQRTRDAVALTLPPAPAAGDLMTIVVDARDEAFIPQRDAQVDVRVTAPDGHVDAVAAQPVAGQPGRFQAASRTSSAGVYRVSADARVKGSPLGSASGAVLVGSFDPEMTDPRVNEDVLQRIARASGGRFLAASDIGSLADRLRAGAPAALFTSRRDLWHTGWSFALVIVLLSAEWLVRRTWGLR
jgi:uncharacterized membrane protein